MGRRDRIPALLLMALLATAGCGGGHRSPTAPRAPLPTGPAPDSPAHAVVAMSWGWEHRDTLAVRELLADDFTFAFAQTDSSGDAYAGRAMTRDQFLRCVRHLFVGGGAYPPAQRIVLYFDPSLIALPDVRPGKTSQWHQEVRTSVDLTIDVGWQVYRVTGYARFFLVRGDSARIPPDLVARGLHPDAGRWYLERWEDESGSAAAPEIADAPAIAARPAEPVPTRNTTWGQIIALYR